MSTEFLKDTENIKLEHKLSNLIDSQLPEFFKNEGTNFGEFLKFYYKWMESHELTISNVTQDEFYIVTEDEQGAFVLETGDNLSLESKRTDSSAYEKNEVISGLTSGATGLVDRNTNTSSSKIYVTGVTKTDFEPGEIIKGTNNRTIGTVVSYQKNPIFASRSLLKTRDVDSTTSSYLDKFSKEFLENIPFSLSADKSLLIKHITDVYRAKGTSSSYDFLFKSLYDIQNLSYYTPKQDILKPSSGDWQKDRSIRILTDDPVSAFESHRVTGQQSGGTGIVNRVETFQSGVLSVTELFLTQIVGSFVVGESVTSNEVDGVSGTGIVQGVVTAVDITSSGTNYKVDDRLTFSGGGGVDAKAKITSVGTGALTTFTLFDGGDGYIEGKPLTVNNFATGGSGFAGKISDVTDSFSFSRNDDIIGNFVSVTLNEDEYELSGNTQSNVSDRLIDSLGFTKVDAGHITGLETTQSGTGYEIIPRITAVESETVDFNEDSIRILNLNPDPDGFASTNAITDFFDSGEKITSNNGNKVGTFFGVIKSEETLNDPIQMRVSTIKFLDENITEKIPTEQRNDLTVNNSTYINSTLPSVYQIKMVSVGLTTTNTIKYRRGINATELFNSANNNGNVEFYPTSGGVDITGGFQTLEFGITSITRASTTATATTYGKHGLDDGQKVIISGASPTAYNGEKTITVTSPTTFTYTVSGSPSTPASGTILYNENVSVKFTLPFQHNLLDEYAFSSVDFTAGEVITGANSDAVATITSGTPFSNGGAIGNNANVGISSEDAGTGSILSVEIQDPGVGFTSVPTITLPGLGAENAELNARIGALSSGVGLYLDDGGQLSSSKKLIDSDFYQDYSYSLRVDKQLNEYQEIVYKLLHPVGTKLFGEFVPEPVEINMGFDSVLRSEKSDTLVQEDTDDILLEDATDSKHEVVYNQNENLPVGTVTITGDSTSLNGTTNAYFISEASENIVTENNEQIALNNPIATNFGATYNPGDHLIIDNEQCFEVLFGEFRLENFLAGTVSTSSSNVISLINLGNNFPSSITTPNTFSANANFVSNTVVTQISSSTNEKVTGIVLRHELDVSNNNILILHSCNGIFDTSSNANSTVGNNSVIDIETFNMILQGTDGDSTGDLLQEDGVSIIALQDSIYRNNVPIMTATFESVKSNVMFGVSTDFQSDFRINDRIKLNSTKEESNVIEIINSTCMVTNTAISSDNSFLFKTEADDNFVLEDGNNFELNTKESNSTKFDNEDIEFKYLLEPTVRGTTNVNGILQGTLSLLGSNTNFTEDLSVGDVISLSSNTLTAQIVSISNSTSLTLNRSLGDGSNGQTITLQSVKNMDLEESESFITLSQPYDGSNNFLNVTVNSSSTGMLLLEDGIGTSNVNYSGNTSTEGKFKYEILSTFNNQIPKFVQS